VLVSEYQGGFGGQLGSGVGELSRLSHLVSIQEQQVVTKVAAFVHALLLGLLQTELKTRLQQEQEQQQQQVRLWLSACGSSLGVLHVHQLPFPSPRQDMIM
jgi:hypothetical protein